MGFEPILNFAIVWRFCLDVYISFGSVQRLHLNTRYSLPPNVSATITLNSQLQYRKDSNLHVLSRRISGRLMLSPALVYQFPSTILLISIC